MRLPLVILLAATIAASANGQPLTNSPTPPKPPRSASREYIKIEITANPTNDFTAAIATNDFRFVGYMGYALVVPGVKDFYSHYEKSNGVKIIDGTSDMVLPTTFPTAVARRYATAYNELLLQYVKASEKK